jgi:hypothetical protein
MIKKVRLERRREDILFLMSPLSKKHLHKLHRLPQAKKLTLKQEALFLEEKSFFYPLPQTKDNGEDYDINDVVHLGKKKRDSCCNLLLNSAWS